MQNSNQKISACLIVYNEEKIVRKCLDSIKGLVDEIIVVHDGECKDRTLEIAREYTDKVFVRPHAGISTLHFVFCFNTAVGDWILLMDADEYLEEKDFPLIREKINNQNGVNRFIFNWEMWNGEKTLRCKGIQKACLFKKSAMHFIGIPHAMGDVDGKTEKLEIFLRHRPLYNNISPEAVKRKRQMWAPLHAKYYFPELVNYECFNTTPDKWIAHAKKIRKYILFYLIVNPLKDFFGQFKNGLWASFTGWRLCYYNYIYYFSLYWQVWQIEKGIKKTR